MKITVKNYKRFDRTTPATFVLDRGLTALVGPNNSGKSSLLRFFYDFRTVISAHVDSLDTLLRSQYGRNSTPGYVEDSEPFSTTSDGSITIRFELESRTSTEPEWIEIALRREDMGAATTMHPWPAKVIGVSSQGTQVVVSSDGGNSRHFDVGRYREFFQAVKDSVYIPGFRHILPGAGEMQFDLQVGQDFVTLWRNLKLGGSRSNARTADEIVEDVARLFGFRRLEVNATADGKTLQLTVDGEPYRLSEVGGGVSEFLQVLTTVATRQPQLVLIDEPELHLHPRLQMDFLTSIAKHARYGVLFATHNLGLARSSAARIYTVTPTDPRRSRVDPFGEQYVLAEVLGELSFGSAVSTAGNAILLVEGRTDVLVFQQFLRALGLDHHYILISLSGADLINGSAAGPLAEIQRLTSRVYAIIDSEQTDPDDPLDSARSAFRDICEQLNIPCHILARRATENYLSDRAIKLVKGAKYRALSEHESLASVDPRWDKKESWRIAQVMTIEEWSGTDLGVFLKSLPDFAV